MYDNANSSKQHRITDNKQDEEQEAGAKSPNIFDQELDRKKQKNMQEDAKEALALGRESVADPQRQDPMVS